MPDKKNKYFFTRYETAHTHPTRNAAPSPALRSLAGTVQRTVFASGFQQSKVNSVLQSPETTRVRNDRFDPHQGLDRGRPVWFEALWYLTKCLLFLPAWPIPARFKCAVLRWFGASVGRGVVIKPRVNIHFPWKLTIGDHAWIGEEVFILNFEPVTIGEQCCVSQRAFLCTGNHDFREPDMPYRNQPITVEGGAWVGAQVFVSPGVTIGMEAVVTAGSVVTKSQPAKMVCSGNPCVPIKQRWLKT